jgi:CubicO group peptidase (beta-lactamase class C family)
VRRIIVRQAHDEPSGGGEKPVAKNAAGPQSGLNPERLEYLRSVIEDDIARDRYLGGAIIVARHGVIGLDAAVGWADVQRQRPVKKDSVFSLFSTTKAITNVLVFRAIELGQFALTTRVSEIIPEFRGGLRETVTFYHLLTHTSGLPSIYCPRPGMYIDRLDEMIAALVATLQCVNLPGERVDYSPLAGHALMGEAVRRVDPMKRSYRQLVEDEILKPLGMKDTSIGVRADLKARHLVPEFRGNAPQEHLGSSNLGPQGAFEEEHAEMPWVGGVSTSADMFRFAEMLRREGELDGARILGPIILRRARRNQTGEKPNELYKRLALERGWDPFPGYIGLGFSLRGEAVCHHLFGTLTSPETFGNYGAGSSLFWVDPELDMTFVFLGTGVMKSTDNIERFQRLSDIAVSAAL